MNKKRKEYYKAILCRPLNFQKPLPNLPTAPTYERLPPFEDSDLVTRFHEYFNVTA
jgi:hypothetical protein